MKIIGLPPLPPFLSPFFSTKLAIIATFVSLILVEQNMWKEKIENTTISAIFHCNEKQNACVFFTSNAYKYKCSIAPVMEHFLLLVPGPEAYYTCS